MLTNYSNHWGSCGIPKLSGCDLPTSWLAFPETGAPGFPQLSWFTMSTMVDVYGTNFFPTHKGPQLVPSSKLTQSLKICLKRNPPNYPHPLLMAGSMQKKEGSAASGQASIEKIEVGWFLFWDPAYLSIFRDGNCYMLHMMNLYLHNLCIQLHT